MGIMDSIGLDTIYTITAYWATTLNGPLRQRHADFVKGYVDQGWLGVKSGRGFYTYPDPAYGRAGFVDGRNARHGSNI
jgi:3-hydroxybutyryl-CoA dehydrogenase